MLHQIRKMVGLMIAVVRGLADMGIMEKAFGKDKVMIPTAPGLGLLLDKVGPRRPTAGHWSREEIWSIAVAMISSRQIQLRWSISVKVFDLCWIIVQKCVCNHTHDQREIRCRNQDE